MLTGSTNSYVTGLTCALYIFFQFAFAISKNTYAVDVGVVVNFPLKANIYPIKKVVGIS